jgi:hypothetical protein
MYKATGKEFYSFIPFGSENRQKNFSISCFYCGLYINKAGSYVVYNMLYFCDEGCFNKCNDEGALGND